MTVQSCSHTPPPHSQSSDGSYSTMMIEGAGGGGGSGAQVRVRVQCAVCACIEAPLSQNDLGTVIFETAVIQKVSVDWCCQHLYT
jgi:hypothetical protein